MMTAKPQRTWPQILTIFPGIRFAVPKLNPGRLWKPDNKISGAEVWGNRREYIATLAFFNLPKDAGDLAKGRPRIF